MVIENEVNLDMGLSQLCHAMSWRLCSHEFFNSASAAPALGAERKLANAYTCLTLPAGTLPHACVCCFESPFFRLLSKCNKHNHCSEVQAYELVLLLFSLLGRYYQHCLLNMRVYLFKPQRDHAARKNIQLNRHAPLI